MLNKQEINQCNASEEIVEALKKRQDEKVIKLLRTKF